MILGSTISTARPFSSMAALLDNMFQTLSTDYIHVVVIFAGGGHAASSRLALNENGHTLNTALPSIMAIETDAILHKE